MFRRKTHPKQKPARVTISGKPEADFDQIKRELDRTAKTVLVILLVATILATTAGMLIYTCNP